MTTFLPPHPGPVIQSNLDRVNSERIARGEKPMTADEVRYRRARDLELTAAMEERHAARLASDPKYRAQYEAAGKAGAAFAKSLKGA